MSQLVKRYEIDNGRIENLFDGDGSAAAEVAVLNALAPYLNITKNCGSTMGCWYDTELSRHR